LPIWDGTWLKAALFQEGGEEGDRGIKNYEKDQGSTKNKQKNLIVFFDS
jgi:hypothetical protein